MNKDYQCEIRPNHATSNGHCAFCGGRTHPQIPLAIFKRGTYQSICDECAEKYAPDMVRALAEHSGLSTVEEAII